MVLTHHGFGPHGTDGKFGKDTEAAVKSFQQAHSLDAAAALSPSADALSSGGT